MVMVKGLQLIFFMGIVMWFSLGIKPQVPNPTKLMPFPVKK